MRQIENQREREREGEGESGRERESERGRELERERERERVRKWDTEIMTDRAREKGMKCSFQPDKEGNKISESNGRINYQIR